MDIRFLQSWKGALLIAAFITVAVTGYKAVFGPDVATRIAETRLRNTFPNGRPSDEVMNRHIVGGSVVSPFGLRLREFVGVFQGVTQAFEPVDARSFVLRFNRIDPVTRQPQEWAFLFRLVNGPEDIALNSGFDGPAVYVVTMAADRVAVSQLELDMVFTNAAGLARRARANQ